MDKKDNNKEYESPASPTIRPCNDDDYVSRDSGAWRRCVAFATITSLNRFVFQGKRQHHLPVPLLVHVLEQKRA